jgi:hypothetical protein
MNRSRSVSDQTLCSSKEPENLVDNGRRIGGKADKKDDWAPDAKAFAEGATRFQNLRKSAGEKWLRVDNVD